MVERDNPSEFQITEPLTKRESDILALLAENLSDREIADRLVVSLNTVKWYNRQIFEKLWVENRRQAVNRAYALGLLRKGAADAPPQHNLPAQTTTFIGRVEELKDLANLLSEAGNRLITILAPGGMGKTRLALKTAETCIAQFVDGVYFVSLTALLSPDQLVPVIADALGLQLTSDPRTPKQQLMSFLGSKHILLVLDNFEHLVASAALLNDLLEAAPHLHILVTSRERLGLNGETLYPLRGMTYPQGGQAEDGLEFGAVQLFLECGRRLQLQMAAEELYAVIRICQMTQGMPLALELAAAWLVALTPSEVADEIARGLDFLKTNLRGIPERQRSVVAVFEASWRHLSPEEQRVFQKLSVFRGGFTREAALAVVETQTDILIALLDKALISRRPHTSRFEIHELLRQFAEEQLKRSGELENTLIRHAAYYADFLNARLPILQSRTPQVPLDEIQTDFDNVRQAVFYLLDWDLPVALGGVAESLRLFFEADVHFTSSVRHPGLPYLSLRLFFEARAHFSGDATTIFRKALARDYPPDVEAVLREGLGDALHVTGAYDASRQEFEQAILLLPPNAWVQRARLLRKEALTLDAQRRLEDSLHVLAKAEEALNCADEHGESWWQEWIAVQNGTVSAYFFLGMVQPILGRTDSIRAAVEQYGTPAQRFDFYVSANMIELLRTRFAETERAMEYARLGLSAARDSGSLLQVATGHFRVGLTHFCGEDWASAETELRAGLAIGERIGNVLTQTLCGSFLTVTYRRLGQVDATEQWAELTLQIATSAGIDLYVAAAKANLAWVSWRRHQIGAAVALAEEAMAIWRRVSPNYPVRWQAQWILLGDALRENRLEDALQHGRELLDQQAPEERIGPALTAAIQAWDAGDEPACRASLSDVSSIATSLGYL